MSVKFIFICLFFGFPLVALENFEPDKKPALILEYTRHDANGIAKKSAAFAYHKLLNAKIKPHYILNVSGPALETAVRALQLPVPTLVLIFGHGGKNESGHYVDADHHTRRDILNPLRRAFNDPGGRRSPIWLAGCESNAAVISPLEATGAAADSNQMSCNVGDVYGSYHERFSLPLLNAYVDADLFDRFDRNHDGFLGPRETSQLILENERLEGCERSYVYTFSSLPCELETDQQKPECSLALSDLLAKLAELKIRFGTGNVTVQTGARYHVTFREMLANGWYYPRSYVIGPKPTKQNCDQLFPNIKIEDCRIRESTQWTVNVKISGHGDIQNEANGVKWKTHAVNNGFFLPRATPLPEKSSVKLVKGTGKLIRNLLRK